jgi:hypothetical protein
MLYITVACVVCSTQSVAIHIAPADISQSCRRPPLCPWGQTEHTFAKHFSLGVAQILSHKRGVLTLIGDCGPKDSTPSVP